MKIYTKLKSKISNFFQELKDWNKIKIILFFVSAFFLFFASFSTMAFSGRYPLNIVNNIAYLFLIIFIILFVSLYGEFKFDIFFVLLLLFNLLILVSSAFSGFRDFSTTIFLVSITSFFVYQLYSNINDNLKEILIKIVFLGGFIFTLYFVIFYHQEIILFDFGTRIGGEFANQNEVSKYFVFLGLYCFYLIVFKKNLFAVLVFFIYLLLILFTGSRSNFLALFILMMFMIFIKLPNNRKGWFLIILITALVLFLAILQIDSLTIFRERFYSMISTLFSNGTNSIDNSTQYRLMAFYEALELFFQRPLFGYGFFGTNLYSFNKMSTHNNFVALLGDFGVFTFIFFETLLLMPIFSFFKKRRKYEKTFLVLVISLVLYIFIFQFFLINYYTKLEYLLLPYAYSVLYKDNNSVSVVLSEKRVKIKVWQ